MIYLTMFPVYSYVATLPGQSYSHRTPVCVVTSQGQQCPLSTPVLMTGPAMFPLYSCQSYHITGLAMPSTPPPPPTPNVLTLEGHSPIRFPLYSCVVTLQGQPCGHITRPAMWSHYKAGHVVALQGQPCGCITRPAMFPLYLYLCCITTMFHLYSCLCCHISTTFPLYYYGVTLQPCSLSTIMLSCNSHVPSLLLCCHIAATLQPCSLSAIMLSRYSHVSSLHPSNLCCHFVGPTRSSRHEG